MGIHLPLGVSHVDPDGYLTSPGQAGIVNPVQTGMASLANPSHSGLSNTHQLGFGKPVQTGMSDPNQPGAVGLYHKGPSAQPVGARQNMQVMLPMQAPEKIILSALYGSLHHCCGLLVWQKEPQGPFLHSALSKSLIRDTKEKSAFSVPYYSLCCGMGKWAGGQDAAIAPLGCVVVCVHCVNEVHSLMCDSRMVMLSVAPTEQCICSCINELVLNKPSVALCAGCQQQAGKSDRWCQQLIRPHSGNFL